MKERCVFKITSLWVFPTKTTEHSPWSPTMTPAGTPHGGAGRIGRQGLHPRALLREDSSPQQSSAPALVSFQTLSPECILISLCEAEGQRRAGN